MKSSNKMIAQTHR